MPEDCAPTMWRIWVGLLAISIQSKSVASSDDPTIFVTLLARNKAHSLPYFLKLFEELDYDKGKMILWIVSDGNQDKTLHVLDKWIPSVRNSYRNVTHRMTSSDNQSREVEIGWSPERFRHVMNLKEEALDQARQLKVDYIWLLDCDVFLINSKVLNILKSLKSRTGTTRKKSGIVAPMLDTLHMDSNFWLGKIEFNYREAKQLKDKKPFVERKAKGCHKVAMVHSCFWIDLKHPQSRHLTFQSDKIVMEQRPMDDILILAISAAVNKIPVFVCNNEIYGYQMEPSTGNAEDEYQNLVDIRLKMLDNYQVMVAHPLLSDYVRYPARDKLGLDGIFVINLERRPEKRSRVEWIFRLLGVNFKLFKAVDGRTLNDSWLISSGIRLYPNYSEPNTKQPMTKGEVGCFLSHFRIWQEIVDRKLEKTLILEDDFAVEPRFRQRLGHVMAEMDRLLLDWDLIYLGRKKMHAHSDRRVKGSDSIVHPGFSYWALAYILSYKGAMKLLQNKPLDQMLPVDEYIPIMFNQRPGEPWYEAVPNRNLKAYAAEPVLIRPYLYAGQRGHISDTTVADVVPKGIIGQPLNDSPEKSVLFVHSELAGRMEEAVGYANVDKRSRPEL